MIDLCRWLLLILMASVLAGCVQERPAQKTASAPPPRRPNRLDNLDACASRLHDICEPLLLFYVSYHRLPASLDELRALSGFENMIYICPVSGLPYIYDPIGIPAPPGNAGAKIILYDATPAHRGLRWAVTIIEPADRSGVLITKVIAVEEKFFAATQPAPPG